MKPDNHPHEWKELSPLGDKWCTVCGRRVGHFAVIQKELWGLPRGEREELMLLIRKHFARYKRDYLDKEK